MHRSEPTTSEPLPGSIKGRGFPLQAMHYNDSTLHIPFVYNIHTYNLTIIHLEHRQPIVSPIHPIPSRAKNEWRSSNKLVTEPPERPRALGHIPIPTAPALGASSAVQEQRIPEVCQLRSRVRLGFKMSTSIHRTPDCQTILLRCGCTSRRADHLVKQLDLSAENYPAMKEILESGYGDEYLAGDNRLQELDRLLSSGGASPDGRISKFLLYRLKHARE